MEAQRARELLGGHRAGHEEAHADDEDAANRPKESLLLAAAKARKDQPAETEQQQQLAEEADILKHVLQKQALKAVKELAQVRGRIEPRRWRRERVGDDVVRPPHETSSLPTPPSPSSHPSTRRRSRTSCTPRAWTRGGSRRSSTG